MNIHEAIKNLTDDEIVDTKSLNQTHDTQIAQMKIITKRKAVENAFKSGIRNGDILVNFHGHFRQGLEPIKLTAIEDKWNRKHLIDKIVGAYDWIEFVFENKPFYGTKENPMPFNYYTYENCGECGVRVGFAWDGEMIHVVHYVDHTNLTDCNCPTPGGLKTYKTKLSVKSGKIVFANDFRSLAPEGDKERYINYNSEIKLMSEDYAAEGLIMAFTGNSCPGIYQDSNILVIGNDNETNTIKGEHVDSVCTDLWWVSAMDYEEFLIRAAEAGCTWKRIQRWIECVVDVTPGEYTITHNVEKREYESGVADIYATFNLDKDEN